MVSIDQFEKMFVSVFDPKKDESILLLYDVPINTILDNDLWRERRELVEEWFEKCSLLKETYGFTVEKKSYNATGEHNAPLHDNILDFCKKKNIVIALTEFSATSSLVNLVQHNKESLRSASMPLAEQRMMDTVFSMDYTHVRHYSHKLKNMLTGAESALIIFNTGDILSIDLRNRIGGADDGDCRRPGSFINLPSGEGFIAPYEAVNNEREQFGKSRTQGILPFYHQNKLVKGTVKQNMIDDFTCESTIKQELISFFDCYKNRRNIGELGIGCNPQAKVTGNFIEDEKVGVHIAYGTSRHLGGKVISDLHHDLVYSKGCRVSAETVTLQYQDRPDILIVKDGTLQYNLLQ